MASHMKTTLVISDDLLRAAKETALREGTTLRALVEEGLRARLRAPRKPFRLRLVTFRGKGLCKGLDEGDWKAILELSARRHVK